LRAGAGLSQDKEATLPMLDQPRREPMLNVPAVVVALLVVLALIHALLVLLLTPEQTTELLLLFAFIPARYDPSVMPDISWPGGFAADIWTFVTYALIHADLSHLIINGVWLLAFCSPLARRFGTLRFIAFMATTAAAGAAVHLVTHWGELLPVIGISASISGAMAATMRFAFQRGGPLMAWRDRDDAYRVPAASLSASLRDPRGRRSGRCLAGAYRRVSGRPCRVRRVRSDSPGCRARPDYHCPLTIALA
jgi:membrane associated rhomboid family serine protease